MNDDNFKEIIYTAYSYFRSSSLPSREVQEIWYNELNYLEDTSTSYIIQQLTKLDNLPRNLPKAIKAFYYDYKRSHPKTTQYDPIDDDRFPIDLMFQALEIMIAKGADAFNLFCRTVNMPAADRQRVLAKYKNCIGDHQSTPTDAEQENLPF